MDRTEQLTALAGVAAGQWGLITTAQAKQAGVGGVQLIRLVEAGLIENVAHGVYLLTSAGQPTHLEIKAAWLRLDPRTPAWERATTDAKSGVVSHASACLLHELGDIPAPKVEISVPRRRTTTDPFVLLHKADVPQTEMTIVDGLPVTTPSRTIVDLLRARADGGHIGGVIADADRRGLISESELAAAVQPFAAAYGLEPTADGEALLRHLVAQAGTTLRSQEIERAAQAGYGNAVEQLTAFEKSLATELARQVNQAVLAALPAAQVVRQIEEALRAGAPAAEIAQRIQEIVKPPGEVLKGLQLPEPTALVTLRVPSIDPKVWKGAQLVDPKTALVLPALTGLTPNRALEPVPRPSAKSTAKPAAKRDKKLKTRGGTEKRTTAHQGTGRS